MINESIIENRIHFSHNKMQRETYAEEEPAWKDFTRGMLLSRISRRPSVLTYKINKSHHKLIYSMKNGKESAPRATHCADRTFSVRRCAGAALPRRRGSSAAAVAGRPAARAKTSSSALDTACSGKGVARAASDAACGGVRGVRGERASAARRCAGYFR